MIICLSSPWWKRPSCPVSPGFLIAESWTCCCPSCHLLEFPTISFKFQVFHWMTTSLTMKITISLSGNIQAFLLLDDMNITNVLVSFSRHINFISSSPNATFKHSLQQERNYGAPKVNFLKPIQNHSWFLSLLIMNL